MAKAKRTKLMSLGKNIKKLRVILRVSLERETLMSEIGHVTKLIQ